MRNDPQAFSVECQHGDVPAMRIVRLMVVIGLTFRFSVQTIGYATPVSKQYLNIFHPETSTMKSVLNA